MKKHEHGFSVVETLIIIVVIGLVGAVGWLVYDRQNSDKNNDQQQNSQISQQAENSEENLQEYVIENEGLTFSYDSEISTVEAQTPDEANDLYIERIKVTTGDATLSITAGIDGIGGSGSCSGDRDECKVIGTKDSTFLNEQVTYRLIEAAQQSECGYEGKPSCDVAPLVTTFFLDTYDGADKFTFGPCCGTITAQAKNTGKKAGYTGTLLVSVGGSKEIQNKDMLTNKDILATIKIIESMYY